MQRPPEHAKVLKEWADHFNSFATALLIVGAVVWWRFGWSNPPPVMQHAPEVPAAANDGSSDAAMVDRDGNDGTNGNNDSSPTPVPHARGWSAEARDAQAEWTAQQAAFQLVSKATGEPVDQDNSKANVRLFAIQDLVATAPIPSGPQLTGDCTAFSSCNAAVRTQASQVLGNGGDIRRLFPPFSYGVGRVDFWRKNIVGAMPPEGCSVACIVRGMCEVGTIAWDDAKDPRGNPYTYNGNLADAWGRNGPPKHLYAIAAKHKLGRVAPLSTVKQLRDAVCNGYGTAFGSDFTGGNFRQVDGRIVCDNITPQLGKMSDQVWHHALCCDAYDGTAEHGPWYHIQNSWYPTSHPAPIDGSPVCGFWVHESVMVYIVAQKDAFAFPDYEGFVERRDEINLLGANFVGRPSLAVSTGKEARPTFPLFRKLTVVP